MDYFQEMNKLSLLEQMADTGALKGKVFQAKALTPARLKGLASIIASVGLYKHMVALTLLLGPVAPALGVAATAVYGMNQFAERATVNSIEFVEGGHLKMRISKSPLVTYEIVCHQNDVVSVCALGDDDLGADDVESNII